MAALPYQHQTWVPPGTLPIFKGDFGSKGTHFKDFSWKIGPFFKNFGVFAMRKPKNLGQSEKLTHV